MGDILDKLIKDFDLEIVWETKKPKKKKKKLKWIKEEWLDKKESHPN